MLTKDHLVEHHGLHVAVATFNRYLTWWGDGFPAWAELVYAFNHDDPASVFRAIEARLALEPPKTTHPKQRPARPVPSKAEREQALCDLDALVLAFLDRAPDRVPNPTNVATLLELPRRELYRIAEVAGVASNLSAHLKQRAHELRSVHAHSA